MLPSGVDPIFPNKHPAGHDVFGRPFYDMVATGFVFDNPFTTPYTGEVVRHGYMGANAHFVEEDNEINGETGE